MILFYMSTESLKLEDCAILGTSLQWDIDKLDTDLRDFS